MQRFGVLALVILFGAAVIACSGSSKTKTSGTGTPTAAGTAARITATAQAPKLSATAAASGTPALFTGATAGATPPSQATDASAVASPTSPADAGTGAPPTPAGAVGVQNTPGAGSDFEATVAAGASGDIFGGSPDDAPHVVSTIPAPAIAPGTTPVIDPTTIAPPNATSSELSLVVDMDASTPGIQTARDVHPGDVFKVAVVILNAPAAQNGIGGVSAFNFELDYDRTKVVAPTIQGGSSTDRNPDLNSPDLGGPDAGWTCLPSPEGDLDDPGGIDGDGNPATGQAFLSCFTPAKGHESGTIVLGVVTFHAIATGSSQMTLSNVAVGDSLGIEFAHCMGDQNDPIVPCAAGTINVQ